MLLSELDFEPVLGLCQAKRSQIFRVTFGKRLGPKSADVAEQAIDLISRHILLLGRRLFPLVFLSFKRPVTARGFDLDALGVKGGEREEVLVTQIGRIFLELGEKIRINGEYRVQG